MSEMINYGGMAATRGEAYQWSFDCAKSKGADDRSAARCADWSAMCSHAVTLTPEQTATLPRFDPKTGNPVGWPQCLAAQAGKKPPPGTRIVIRPVDSPGLKEQAQCESTRLP
jgi:hypothetical protein